MRKKVYLVSTSPRRKAILSKLLGGRYFVLSNFHNEVTEHNKDPYIQVRSNCIGKIRSAEIKPSNSILIASDTVVVLGRRILGKPVTRISAIDMLKLISGKVVYVISGVAVLDTQKAKLLYAHEKTAVKIKKLSIPEIKKYVSTGEPLDKAGAFAIQGRGGSFVEWIEGELSNVIGLPVQQLLKILRQCGAVK